MTTPLFAEFQNISPSYAIDYFLMIFFSSIGIIQLAAISAQLTGIILIPYLTLAKSIATLLVILPIIWFFAKTNRNINDYAGGLDANDQAVLFLAGAILAMMNSPTIATLSISSMVNKNLFDKNHTLPIKLHSLKNSTYYNLIKHVLRNNNQNR